MKRSTPFPMPSDIFVGESLAAYVKRVGTKNVPKATRDAMARSFNPDAVPKPSDAQNQAAIAMLRELVAADEASRAVGCQGYARVSLHARMWNRARAVLKRIDKAATV